MRKLFFQMMVSLDGYHEGPGHALDGHVTAGPSGRPRPGGS
ncbi:MAG: hypothetical protein ABSB58_02980 [Gemmatimonadales bacterium]